MTLRSSPPNLIHGLDHQRREWDWATLLHNKCGLVLRMSWKPAIHSLNEQKKKPSYEDISLSGNMWNAWNQLWTSCVFCLCHTNGLKKMEAMWDPHCVKMSTAENLETAANIYELLARKCHLTLKLVEDHLHVKWGIIFHILHDSLGVRNICTKWIPHSLLDEHRITTCEDLSRFIKPFHSIFWYWDKSWVFQYHPQTQCQSLKWRTK